MCSKRLYDNMPFHERKHGSIQIPFSGLKFINRNKKLNIFPLSRVDHVTNDLLNIKVYVMCRIVQMAPEV